MNSETLPIVRFAPKCEHGFYDTVKAKVREYFATHHISPYANMEMWMKTIFMLLLYFVPYVLVATGAGPANTWLFQGFWFLMGL